MFIFLISTFFVLLCSCQKIDVNDTVTVTFDYKDGETVTSEVIPRYTKIDKPQNLDRTGLIFEGWYRDSNYEKKYKFSKKVTEDITLHAKYSIDYDSVNKRINDGELKSHVGIKITYFNRFKSSYSLGSGVVIDITDSQVFILSNSHLSKKNHGLSNLKFEIYDYLDNCSSAKLVYDNSEYDLAIFSCDKFSDNFKIIDYGKDHRPEQEILAIGRPFGVPNKVSYGVITGDVLGPKLTCDMSDSNVNFNVIQHTAYINLGSSGGALLNLNLELIGIQYAVKLDEKTNGFINGYAVPLNKINDFFDLYEEFKQLDA